MRRKAKKFLGLASLTKATRLNRPLSLATKRAKTAPRFSSSPFRIRVPIFRFDVTPERSAKDAKAQLNFMRRSARALRKFDSKEKAVMRQLLHIEAADVAEQRRQQHEGAREELRQAREAESARRRRRQTLHHPHF